MMIRVMYPNGDYDMVRNDLFDLLLAKQRVKKFMRGGMWIDVEREADKVRSDAPSVWKGIERRGHLTH